MVNYFSNKQTNKQTNKKTTKQTNTRPKEILFTLLAFRIYNTVRVIIFNIKQNTANIIIMYTLMHN